MIIIRSNERGVVMPAVIFMIVIMSLVCYAALLQANNSLSLGYKQSYIQMARQASKAGVDYAQEQFETAACDTATGLSTYNGTTETQVSSTDNTRYKITFKVDRLSTNTDGTEMKVQSTGSVYLPKISTTAQYVFDIRSEIIRSSAPCKNPLDFDPLLWLDASNTSTLFTQGTTTATLSDVTTFGAANASSRDTMEERADNGAQTTNSWQSTDLETHTCDSTEFTSSICTTNSTKYLYEGIVFDSMNIPQNATITSATISYACASGGASGALSHRVYGIYKSSSNPHPDLFVSGSSNQLRNKMTTSNLHTTALQDISTNNCPPGQGMNFTVTNIVQEIVNNSNWIPASNGGRLGFGIQRQSGSGKRNFDKDAIRLTVTYSVSGSPQPAANTNTIQEWHDISGNGYHAIANHGSYATRQDSVINGKTIVRFNGDADLLSTLATAATGANLTIFTVGKFNNSSSSNARVISLMNSSDTADTGNANSVAALTRNGSGNGGVSRYNADSNTASISNVFNGSATAFIVNYLSAEAATMRQNGNTATGDTLTLGYNANQIYIGGNRSGGGTGSGANYFNGDLGEVIAYKNTLSCKQVEAVLDYLRLKWSLSGSAFTSTCPVEDPVPTL